MGDKERQDRGKERQNEEGNTERETRKERTRRMEDWTRDRKARTGYRKDWTQWTGERKERTGERKDRAWDKLRQDKGNATQDREIRKTGQGKKIQDGGQVKT